MGQFLSKSGLFRLVRYVSKPGLQTNNYPITKLTDFWMAPYRTGGQ
jgi:hypothetical protein